MVSMTVTDTTKAAQLLLCHCCLHSGTDPFCMLLIATSQELWEVYTISFILAERETVACWRSCHQQEADVEPGCTLWICYCIWPAAALSLWGTTGSLWNELFNISGWSWINKNGGGYTVAYNQYRGVSTVIYLNILEKHEMLHCHVVSESCRKTTSTLRQVPTACSHQTLSWPGPLVSSRNHLSHTSDLPKCSLCCVMDNNNQAIGNTYFIWDKRYFQNKECIWGNTL